MADRILIWSPDAEKGFDKILTFYRERNGNSEYGDKLKRLVRKALDRVITNPYSGQRWWGKRGFRFVVVKPFQLFYRVTKTEIIVSAVWDARRDPKTLKLIR